MSFDDIVGPSTTPVEASSEPDVPFVRQIVAHHGQPCTHHEDAPGPLTCPLASLICTSAVFNLEQKLTAKSLMMALCSQTDEHTFDPVNKLLSGATDMTSTDEPLGLAVGFRVEELLTTPSFRPLFLELRTSECITSYWGFLTLLDNLPRNPRKICAAIINYAQETIACFKFVLDVGFPETYLVFDPHARPYRPSGPGFMLSRSKDAVASALARLCTFIKPLMERTYFGSHLFSFHILLPRDSYRDHNAYLPSSDSSPLEEESNEENPSASRLEDQRFSVTEVDHLNIPDPLPELSTNPLGMAPLFWRPETE